MVVARASSLVIVLAVVAACGDDDGARDAGRVDGSVPSTSCAVDALRMRVVKLGAGDVPSGRLAVAWFQLSDDGPDPQPYVAYSAPFEGASDGDIVEVPLDEVLPTNPENLLCERTCNDELTCPCTSEPAVGLGYVFVWAAPVTTGGPVDFDDGDILGLGYVVVGYSATRFVPATELPLSPVYWQQKFPDGVADGICPFRVVTGEGFDNLGLPAADMVFDLSVCGTENPGCEPPDFNLT